MLTLTRKSGQRIIIEHAGEKIVIAVERVLGKGDQVKVCIEAPKEAIILREELIREDRDRHQ